MSDLAKQIMKDAAEMASWPKRKRDLYARELSTAIRARESEGE